MYEEFILNLLECREDHHMISLSDLIKKINRLTENKVTNYVILMCRGYSTIYKDDFSLIEFFKERKKWWLIPIILFLLLFGSIIVVSQGSSVAPFIYAIF